MPITSLPGLAILRPAWRALEIYFDYSGEWRHFGGPRRRLQRIPAAHIRTATAAPSQVVRAAAPLGARRAPNADQRVCPHGLEALSAEIRSFIKAISAALSVRSIAAR